MAPEGKRLQSTGGDPLLSGMEQECLGRYGTIRLYQECIVIQVPIAGWASAPFCIPFPPPRKLTNRDPNANHSWRSVHQVRLVALINSKVNERILLPYTNLARGSYSSDSYSSHGGWRRQHGTQEGSEKTAPLFQLLSLGSRGANQPFGTPTGTGTRLSRSDTTAVSSRPRARASGDSTSR